MSQAYGGKSEWKKHFEYLLPFFKDSRYIINNDMPLFVIYKPEIVPCINEMLDYWQELVIKSGLKGISFAYQYPDFHFKKEKDDSRFDLAIEFEPLYSNKKMNLDKSKIERIISILFYLKLGIMPFVYRLKRVLINRLGKGFFQMQSVSPRLLILDPIKM